MNNKKLKICAVSTTRADYGIMRPLLRKLDKQEWAELIIVVTGTHLLNKYGYTINEIIDDGFSIDERISIIKNRNNTVEDISEIMSKAIRYFTEYFSRTKPDLVILLGDRFETFQIAAAATITRTPIVHIAGGETTQGAVDEAFRHGITKMSYLHFTETEEYRKRVIQLGEDPKRVINTGSLGVENVLNTKCLTKKQLAKQINFDLTNPYCVVTFHPVTLEENSPINQLNELLKLIENKKDYNFIITKSNADLGGEVINNRLDEFEKDHDNCIVVASLGTLKYFSAIKYSKCVIGNSSSGIVETPSFGIATINIGDRQKGRVQGNSIINCKPQYKNISSAFNQALLFDQKVINPYMKKGSSNIMVRMIKNTFYNRKIDLMKRFYDLEF